MSNHSTSGSKKVPFERVLERYNALPRSGRWAVIAGVALGGFMLLDSVLWPIADGLNRRADRLELALTRAADRAEGLPDEVVEAGQERFNSMHPAYYHQAHACILCFDVTRKQTYKNLPTWVKELRDYRSKIPTICIANKVDVDAKVMSKDFAFPKKHNMKLYFCSAADGTNVVSAFEDAIQSAHEYKNSGEVDDVDLLLSLVNGTASMRVSKEEGGGEGATAAVPAS